MPATSTFQGVRAIALAALAVHVVIGLVSSVLFVAAFRFRLDYFLDLASLVDAGPVSAELLRWAATADLLSYYLPVPVIAYALWCSLRPRSAVVADLSLVAACAYAVAGGIGAVMLAVVAPSLMHARAAGADPAVTVVFAAVTTTVYAIWQVLDPLLLSAWWLGASLLLRRDHRRFAVVMGALGGTAAVGALLTLVKARPVLGALAGVVFVLWTAWEVWLFVLIWRRAEPFDILAVDTSDHV
ncbi:hypothetical protein [Raineyella fluvialis]|uniref:DUF4386 family protein n=1 Tax=Raineyella fluvialis TaxID=2662261 RepID=A0A5Q2F9K0_9ACTN|nr:hypothetical protein [Raineyella fluvialis]QGF23479.1 hypothetical protein Rai3103_07135 [Raineyella fluvialis]